MSKCVELKFSEKLDRKIISKIGNPFKFDNVKTQENMNKYYGVNNIIEGKTILVIRMLPMAKMYARNNKVIYITDNREMYDEFLEVINDDKYGGDDEVKFFYDWKNFKEVLKDMPKFDIAIMNPPYDRNLHLKILEQVIPHAEKVVNISPVRWLQDPLAKYKKTSDYKRFEESVSKKIESFEVMPSSVSNKLFDIATGDLGIYVCGNGGYDYDEPSRMKLGAKYSVIDKMLKKMTDNIDNHFMFGCSTLYNVKVTELCGSGIGLVVNYIHNKVYANEQEYKQNKFKKKDCFNTNSKEKFISFNSKIEAENYLNSVYTKFHRFCVLNLQLDVHVPLKFLPFMGDYTQPWDDKRFCDYFGITGYISDTEAEPNSEWELILNTMKD